MFVVGFLLFVVCCVIVGCCSSLRVRGCRVSFAVVRTSAVIRCVLLVVHCLCYTVVYCLLFAVYCCCLLFVGC